MTLKIPVLVQVAFVTGLLSGCLTATANGEPAPLTAGMQIATGKEIKAGEYRLPDAGEGAVQIHGRGFTVDFHGAKLRGAGDGKGIGIRITDSRGVTIKNADVSGYQWGIVLERSTRVKLIHCITSRNADLTPGTVIDESGTQPEDNHGGGIVLRDCQNCKIQKCISQHQWDGIDVVRSNDNVIEDGDYSYNGNWGIHLWTASRNIFRRNKAIWCTTGSGLLFQALTGWQTYDSQAVGIDHNSNENTIEENDLRFGGDAIFIRANEGPITPGTSVPPRNGSDRNRLINNDCSYSPNNAIEVDFVDGTVIEGNNCSFSNYGLWLGYARHCTVSDNICVNDSSHAVEIEDGQEDLFERNVFGWDTSRPNGPLVLLRQNYRDKTPSGPYTFNANLFYGAGAGVQLIGTPATFRHNYIFSPSEGKLAVGKLVTGDASSPVQEQVTISVALSGQEDRERNSLTTLSELTPGASLPVRLTGWHSGEPPPVVELNGIPLWLRRNRGGFQIQIPQDNWDRPASSESKLRVCTLQGVHERNIGVKWPGDMPRITSITPNPGKIGDNFTISGTNLQGGRVLMNGRPAAVLAAALDAITLKAPEGILTPTRFNVVWQRGEGENQIQTWPITLGIQVPTEQMPHLVSAEFSPTTLKVGEMLKVIMKVRNNLPVPALLTTKPAPSFTYDEKQAWYDIGYGEMVGHLNLRVSTDFVVGGHDPGSWPWLFGFGQESLAPGESTTVTGYIRVETPGVHEFRIGLVAGGARFIDDNAYRTKITVLP